MSPDSGNFARMLEEACANGCTFCIDTLCPVHGGRKPAPIKPAPPAEPVIVPQRRLIELEVDE